MNFEEFLKPEANQTEESPELVQASAEVPEEAIETENLDVQKAVVESLAADKAEQDETIEKLRKENAELQSELAKLKQKLTEQDESLAKVGEVLSKNAEGEGSSKIALLDRDLELADRFPGETREQVLEVIKEARDRADAEGRLRRAQVLEGVLVANEPSGELAKKREELRKFFNENQNILSGPVIEELQRRGISHKNGEDYLLPAEILKRIY